MMFDFRMETFLVAAKTLNFTAAAKELHITQPAVSMHIHQLEEDYQTKFFEHKGKQIHLTENGKLLFQVASRMKNDDQHMRQHFQSKKEITELNFGTTLSIADFCLQHSLKKLWTLYPNFHLRLFVQNTETLLERIHQGSLDFAIVEGYYSKELYDSISFQTQEYLAVCHPSHVFSNPVSNIHDLCGEPLLIREEGSGTREILERMLSLHELTLQDFQVLAEIGSLHVIKECVRSDIGISFFYRPVVEEELKQGTLKQIMIEEQFHHTFSCVWSKQSIFAKQYQQIGMLLTEESKGI